MSAFAPSARAKSARLSSAVRIARTELSAALDIAESAPVGSCCERLVRAHSRAFNAASAAAHLPCAASCMEMVGEAERFMDRHSINFYR